LKKIKFYLKEKEPVRAISRFISYRWVNILQDRLNPVNPIPAEFSAYKKDLFHYSVHQLLFSYNNPKTINPFGGVIDLQANKEMVRSTITANYKISYKKEGKGIDLRLFAGSFLYDNIRYAHYGYNDINDYSFQLSGKGPAENFQNDYLFDEILLGRTETDGIFSQQLTNTEGAFKVKNPLTKSFKWMTTMNIEIAAPGKIPLRFFADIGTYEGIKNSFVPVDISYDVGLVIPVFKDVFKVYIPVGMSKELQYYNDKIANPGRPLKLAETIRFQINFKMLNPFHLVKNIQI